MAKKKKKKKPNISSLPENALREKANRALEQGKLREARDYFKILFKRNNEKYKSDLIRVSRTIAQSMIEKGRLSEARMVLEYLRQLTGKDENGLLNVVSVNEAIQKGDYAHGSQMAIVLVLRGDYSNNPADIANAIDLAVLSFDTIPQLQSEFPEVHDELCAVHRAIEKVGKKEYDDAVIALRGVGIASVFSEWKLFIKGLLAFYQMDDVRALKAFKRLQSARLSRLAKPFILLLDFRIEVIKNDDHKIEFLKDACWVSGFDTYCSILPKAEYLWRIHRYRDSLKFVDTNLATFPSSGTGIEGLLTNFYYTIPFSFEDNEKLRYIEYYATIPQFGIPQIKRMYIAHLMCQMTTEMGLDGERVVDGWRTFIDHYKKVNGENRSLEAQVYLFLGERFIGEDVDAVIKQILSLTGECFYVQNPELTEECLNRCLDLEPENRDASIYLLYLHESNGEKKKANRLLEKMVKTHENDKDVLLMAAMACDRRSVHTKAITYAERAKQLDPLDSRLKGILAMQYIKHARNHVGKFVKTGTENSRRKFRNAMENALSNSVENGTDLTRGTAFILVRYAALEFIAGSEKQGYEYLKRALATDIEKMVIFYFGYFIFKVYGASPDYQKYLKNEFDNHKKKIHNLKAVTCLVHVFDYVECLERRCLQKKDINELERLIVSARSFPFFREDVKTIMDFCFRHNLDAVIKTYCHTMLNKDPSDPLFSFYMLASKKKNMRYGKGPLYIQELERYKTEAERRNDTLALALINDTLQKITFAAFNLFTPDLDDLDDEIDEDDFWLDFEEKPDVFGEFEKGKKSSRKKHRR